jgi:hypothetical protein
MAIYGLFQVRTELDHGSDDLEHISLPEGVLRSRLSRKLMKATPYALRSARAFTKCFSDRP